MKFEKRKEKYEKISKFLNDELTDEVVDEKLIAASLRANQFYSKVIKKYMNTVAVIEFNMIRHLKQKATEFKGLENLTHYVETAIYTLETKEDISKIEKIELRTLYRFKEEVIDGKGKEYDVTKGFTHEYDGEKVEFDPINIK